MAFVCFFFVGFPGVLVVGVALLNHAGHVWWIICGWNQVSGWKANIYLFTATLFQITTMYKYLQFWTIPCCDSYPKVILRFYFVLGNNPPLEQQNNEKMASCHKTKTDSLENLSLSTEEQSSVCEVHTPLLYLLMLRRYSTGTYLLFSWLLHCIQNVRILARVCHSAGNTLILCHIWDNLFLPIR